ncbi:MAG TPA: DUF2971 domain-containing protein [Nitrososphaera sp.]|jgi:hypothetical protein|nr:DUF2971 domain-containing protein [Nitrososphaera sp.]
MTRLGAYPAVVPPADDTKVWRYMDFAKFVSILDRKELFFCRADKFDDPLEGTTPAFNRKIRMELYQKHYPDTKKEQLEDMFSQFDAFLTQRRSKVLVNAWHMNEVESAAMWDLYSQRNSGIAIQTNYRRLSDSLDKSNSDEIYIGMVKYIDFNREWMDEGNLHYPFLHKRKSFEHEKELRAFTELPVEGVRHVIPDHGEPYDEIVKDKSDPKQKTENGKYVTVDVDKLIEFVYVSPRAPKWLGDLVKGVVARYGLRQDQIINSDLYSVT